MTMLLLLAVIGQPSALPEESDSPSLSVIVPDGLVPAKYNLTPDERCLFDAARRISAFHDRMLTHGYADFYPRMEPYIVARRRDRGETVEAYRKTGQLFTEDWRLLEMPKFREPQRWQPVWWSLLRKRIEATRIINDYWRQEGADQRAIDHALFELPERTNPFIGIAEERKAVDAWLKDKPGKLP